MVVNPIDATGAGDAFAAGFLYGWCETSNVRRGLEYGCACGSAAVGQLGGSTPLTTQAVDATMSKEGVMGSFLVGPNAYQPFQAMAS